MTVGPAPPGVDPAAARVVSVGWIWSARAQWSAVPRVAAPSISGNPSPDVLPPATAVSAVLTNSVVARRVELLPGVWVGACGFPVNAGEAICAYSRWTHSVV